MAVTVTPRTRNTRTAATTQDEDEYAGLWINVGVETAEEGAEDGETHFNRLPRGIAVSDLKDHKIYASTNAEWSEEAQLVNSIMDMIREKGLELAEGESMPINLSVQLYRRQEQVEQVANRQVSADLESKLFG